MRKAYHSIPPKFIDSVEEAGVILPASYRLSPRGILQLIYSSDRIDEGHVSCCGIFEEGPFADRNRDLSKKMFGFLQDYIEDRLKEYEEWQRKLGIRPIDMESGFTCLDFLAGDLDCVFLSLDEWARFVPANRDERHTGLIFDAEDLVQQGAAVRRRDAFHNYRRVLEYMMYEEDLSSYGAFVKAIESRLEKAKSKVTLQGAAALRYLREKPPVPLMTQDRYRPEILWCGPLPVDMAVQVMRWP